MPKKGKSKATKMPGKKVASRKRTSPKKSPKKKNAKTPKSLPLKASGPVAEVVTDDPVGACYWADTTGQNHCEVTTQTLCKQRPNSTFRANKQCAGGL